MTDLVSGLIGLALGGLLGFLDWAEQRYPGADDSHIGSWYLTA